MKTIKEILKEWNEAPPILDCKLEDVTEHELADLCRRAQLAAFERAAEVAEQRGVSRDYRTVRGEIVKAIRNLKPK